MSKDKIVSDLSKNNIKDNKNRDNNNSEVYMNMDTVIMMQNYASNKGKNENKEKDSINVESTKENENKNNEIYLESVLGTHIVIFAQKVIESKEYIYGLRATFNDFTINGDDYSSVDEIIQAYIDYEKKLGNIKEDEDITVEKIKKDYEEHEKEDTQKNISLSEIEATIKNKLKEKEDEEKGEI